MAMQSQDKEQITMLWETFIDRTSSFRSELFGTGLRLTGNPFDAEDLVQDSLLKAFVAISTDFGRVTSERAYLHKILSNLWIDQIRRSRLEPSVASTPEPISEDDSAESGYQLSKAAYQLFSQLPHRERVCLVLQDVCEFSQADVADMLGISVAAVKVAVHRARKRLNQSAPDVREPIIHAVSDSLLRRFVTAMTDHDVPALREIMVDSFQAEVFPHGKGTGFDEHVENGWIRGCLYHHIEWREQQNVPYPLDLQILEVAHERVILVIRNYNDGKGAFLEEVWRFQEEEGQLKAVKDYGFSPDLVQFVAKENDLAFRAVGYRLERDTYADPE